MPGFFTALGRIIQGKPVFEVGEQTSHQPTASGHAATGIDKGNANTFPLVYVKDVHTDINGNHMHVRCHIHNEWHGGQILLDKIRLLGITKELDTYLAPGEAKDFVVYDGPRFQREQYHEALLDYRTNDGDYFETAHDVRFRYDGNAKLFDVDAIRYHSPVRDIYG